MKKITDAIIAKTSEVILGKEQQIKLALACILAKGHLLIEDLPGMGKTTLAHTLAQVLGLQFQRVQFTSDLLPADVLGVSVYDRNTANFKFHPGPIFTNILLADEINRATPKTQSALLEVMEEAQVTIDAVTYTLPQPFFVIATQNPSSQLGTFALPESQLDRFLMRITLNYPDAISERKLLQNNGGREQLAMLSAVIDGKQLQALQTTCQEVHVSDALLDYLQAILKYTRQSAQFNAGLSPRAGLSLKQCAQAWAMLEGRDHVIPEDIQAILPSVAMHRLVSNNPLTSNSDKIDTLLKAVAV
jgi:MoxR-like ATPase